MPTYLCATAAGQLSQNRKADIAREITRIHAEVTGAPSYFAQVIFHEIPGGNHFMGGAPLEHKTLFVHGHIRSGRTANEKQALITTLTAAVGEAAGLPQTGVWVYIAELSPAQMVEFGQVLPEPGEEEAWANSLPSATREFMQGIGPRKSR